VSSKNIVCVISKKTDCGKVGAGLKCEKPKGFRPLGYPKLKGDL